MSECDAERLLRDFARVRETEGEKVAESETGLCSVCVCVCVSRQIVREGDAGMDTASESLLSHGILLQWWLLVSVSPEGMLLCHLTHTYSTKTHTCSHTHTHKHISTQSSQTAYGLLGISLFLWGARTPTILRGWERCSFSMYWFAFGRYAHSAHTQTMACKVQPLLRGGIHYCPAKWQQGHASRRSAFCQNWHREAAAAQDLCITPRLFILDIFSSVGGLKSLQHNNILLKATSISIFHVLQCFFIPTDRRNQEKHFGRNRFEVLELHYFLAVWVSLSNTDQCICNRL